MSACVQREMVVTEDELEGLTASQLHDMANIRGGMALGILASHGVISRGGNLNDLQTLLHQTCNDWQELERRKRELTWKHVPIRTVSRIPTRRTRSH